MKYFSNILLLLFALLSYESVGAVELVADSFITKRGKGSGHQVVMSGDSIKPYYYEYKSSVFIDHVQLPDAFFTVNHDKKNRKIHLSGVTGGPTRTYQVRMWGLITDDSLGLKNERITRSGDLTVLRPYYELDSTSSTVYNIDTETILDTIKLNYTKFTYAVWTSDLPSGMKLEKYGDHCEIVSTEYLPSGEYSFKLYGADSLFFTKDSIVFTDGGGYNIDIIKFHPKEYSDSITFKINVYEGGLMKIGTGGTKQIVEIGDSIEKFGFKWNIEGQLITEPIAAGLEMVIDSTEKDIWIQGAPTKVGSNNFDLAYYIPNSDHMTVYEIQIQVLNEIRPIIEYEGHILNQVVSVGEMIDDIVLSYYNSDTVWVEGLPDGIRSEINDEDGEIYLYGTLNESGKFDIKVHARNSKYETELNLNITSSDKAGGYSGIDDVLSEDESEVSVTYDMLGRRVSPQNMVGKPVYIVKKKIVIRK